MDFLKTLKEDSRIKKYFRSKKFLSAVKIFGKHN